MKLINIDSVHEPLAIVARDRNGEHYGPIIKYAAKNKQLLMLGWSGMYWLVPHEVANNIMLQIDLQEKLEGTLNTMHPLTIELQQCIPIPSETAKILLEL